MSKILLSCGANGNGQLGIGRSDVALFPEYVQVALPSGEDLMHATCGSYHTLAVMRSGKVFTWGMNKSGQLGLTPDTVVTQSTPTRLRIPAPSNASPQHLTRDGDMKILQAAAGDAHTVLLSASGHVFTFGSNSAGQLGRVTTGDHTFSFVPTVVDFSSTTVAALQPQLTICSVFAGPSTTFAITPSGHLFGWGGSSSHELGFQQGIVPLPKSITLPSSIHHSFKVVKVAAGTAHTLLLTSTGEVFVSGDNTDGQLGVQGTAVSTWRAVRHAKNLRDVSTCSQQSFFLTAMGILSECGMGEHGAVRGKHQANVMEAISALDGSVSTPPSTTFLPPGGSVSAPPQVAHAPDLVYGMQEHECNGVASAGTSVIAWSEAKGEIYVRGRNHRGQLGLGHISPVACFAKLDLSKKVQQTLQATANASGKPAPKVGKLLKVCMGRAHALVVYSVQGGGDDQSASPTGGSRSTTPRLSEGNEVHAMGEIFANADDLEVPQHDSSDGFGESQLSTTDASFRRSCVDDLTNLSFSRAKAPALSFASANKSTTTTVAASTPAGAVSTPIKAPIESDSAASTPSSTDGFSKKLAVFGLVMSVVAVGVVVARQGKRRQ